jgi:hypothetical protein
MMRSSFDRAKSAKAAVRASVCKRVRAPVVPVVAQ